MNAFDNIRLWEGAIVFGFVLLAAVFSRLLIFSFRHIPMTGQTGGEEALYALVGGTALAFSAPMFPLLVVCLTVAFTTGKAFSESERACGVALLPTIFFLAAFLTVFVITISGAPYAIASTIYKWKTSINVIGGAVIAFHSIRDFAESTLFKSLRFLRVSKGTKGSLAEAPILGFIAGLLLFHHLDPFYDSVFFLTGRAGAPSHHPLSVSSFGLGLTAMYIALAYGVSLLTASRQVANGIAWLKGTASILSLILGLSFATGTFPSLVGLITKGY